MNTLSRTICIASLAFTGSSCFAADDMSSTLGDIITDFFNSADHFAVNLTEKSLKFNGVKQREYELTMAQRLSPRVSVEATLHYEKGRLDYGALNQKVSSRSYQVASWYQMDGYSLGISNKVISDHKINIPLASTIGLPTSQAVALNVRTEGLRDTHELAISAVRETWNSDNPALGLSWTKAYDNQVKMSYSIIF